MSFLQLDAFLVVHRADQPDTTYRWSGRDHDRTGSKSWSSSVNYSAYVQ